MRYVVIAMLLVGCGAEAPVPAPAGVDADVQLDAGRQLGCLGHWERSDGGVCVYE